MGEIPALSLHWLAMPFCFFFLSFLPPFHSFHLFIYLFYCLFILIDWFSALCVSTSCPTQPSGEESGRHFEIARQNLRQGELRPTLPTPRHPFDWIAPHRAVRSFGIPFYFNFTFLFFSQTTLNTTIYKHLMVIYYCRLDSRWSRRPRPFNSPLRSASSTVSTSTKWPPKVNTWNWNQT